MHRILKQTGCCSIITNTDSKIKIVFVLKTPTTFGLKLRYILGYLFGRISIYISRPMHDLLRTCTENGAKVT